MPPPWKLAGVKLIGLFGYRDDLVAAFKHDQTKTIEVARQGQVVRYKKDGKVTVSFRVAKIELDRVELEKVDDETRRKTLKLEGG